MKIHEGQRSCSSSNSHLSSKLHLHACLAGSDLLSTAGHCVRVRVCMRVCVPVCECMCVFTLLSGFVETDAVMKKGSESCRAAGGCSSPSP